MRLFKLLLLITLVFIANHAYSGVAPIKNLPDYNGTYWGAPGTGGNCDSLAENCDSTAGRAMFTTLYRDNYERNSGCAGEGCGKHPGVDIVVEADTPVLASLAGEVVESECDWNRIRGWENGALGFGGLVIIKAKNPYASGDVYVSYAHMNSRTVSVGDVVTQGQVIGYSGGDDVNGVCPGFSSGNHLHFQVDKYPPVKNKSDILIAWYPTGKVESMDSDFEVTKKTYNPLPFVTGKAYNFTFSESKNYELWTVGNATSRGVSGGSLWIDGEGSNVYAGRTSYIGGNVACGESAACSTEITLDADVFKKMVLDIDFKCPAGKTTVYYRGPDDVWRSFTFGYTSAKKYTLTLSNLTYWKGIITDFMIKPSGGCTANSGSKEYFIKQMYFSK